MSGAGSPLQALFGGAGGAVGTRLQAAVVRQLAGRVALGPLAVFDMPPARAPLPHAVVDDPVLAAWNAAGVSGREGRIAVTLHDAGERPVRLRRLQAQVEDLLATMPAALGDDGWRLVRLRLLRSRVTRGRGDRWSAVSEYDVRVCRTD